MTLSAGKIIGIVVITCALLLILIVVVWYKFMKKRNEHQPQLAAPLKIVPVPLEEAKDDRKLSFHSVNRAQHFRERAQIAEREAKSDPNRRRSSFQAIFF